MNSDEKICYVFEPTTKNVDNAINKVIIPKKIIIIGGNFETNPHFNTMPCIGKKFLIKTFNYIGNVIRLPDELHKFEINQNYIHL